MAGNGLGYKLPVCIVWDEVGGYWAVEVADDGMWFDSWPGVMELPLLADYTSATPAQRPLKITFGDGSPLSERELEEFVSVYDAHGFPLTWKTGDVAVFCNFRFAHGRPGFKVPPSFPFRKLFPSHLLRESTWVTYNEANAKMVSQTAMRL